VISGQFTGAAAAGCGDCDADRSLLGTISPGELITDSGVTVDRLLEGRTRWIVAPDGTRDLDYRAGLDPMT
jgi:hypothetical protein